MTKMVISLTGRILTTLILIKTHNRICNRMNMTITTMKMVIEMVK